jgi:CheY-like chemotaxis protein
MTDNGVGMDADTREKIFEPFFTTKEVGTGTGLGLAVVYGVVQGHGGVVECTSTPGWGTTFRIWLPMIQAAEIGARRSWAISEETGTPREGLDPINGSGKTILLADGEAPVRATTADLLGSMGFRVIQAATCEEALDNCRRYFASIDLVLLGHGLPGIDGRNCLKEILLIDPRAAVIVAAGPGGEELRETVVEEGAKGFLRKPYGPQTLSAALQSALRA